MAEETVGTPGLEGTSLEGGATVEGQAATEKPAATERPRGRGGRGGERGDRGGRGGPRRSHLVLGSLMMWRPRFMMFLPSMAL